MSHELMDEGRIDSDLVTQESLMDYRLSAINTNKSLIDPLPEGDDLSNKMRGIIRATADQVMGYFRLFEGGIVGPSVPQPGDIDDLYNRKISGVISVRLPVDYVPKNGGATP